MTQRDDTGREEGSGWGTCVYLWRIHVDIWQNQYNIVKLKKKKNLGIVILALQGCNEESLQECIQGPEDTADPLQMITVSIISADHFRATEDLCLSRSKGIF